MNHSGLSSKKKKGALKAPFKIFIVSLNL